MSKRLLGRFYPIQQICRECNEKNAEYAKEKRDLKVFLKNTLQAGRKMVYLVSTPVRSACRTLKTEKKHVKELIFER